MKHYRSSIPKTAKERFTAALEAEYVLDGKVVGIRRFHPTGELEYECPRKDGVAHGIEYRSDVPGKLISATSYSNGMPHGKARQWSDDGKLIGTYTMRRGTGIDLWWNLREDGSRYLSEARYVIGGQWHGFEWWLDTDQKCLWHERHFWLDQLHGIERQWNHEGRLRRGYPKYWVNGARITKRQYLCACASDPTLPPFLGRDNRPQRRFPPEVAARLRHPS